MDAATRILRDVVEEKGWRPGTSLENRVCLLLSRFGCGPKLVKQQYRVGRYRLDFAVPQMGFALEADGWHHRNPASAGRDAERDSELRHLGWLVFRVDDTGTDDDLGLQVARVARVINMTKDNPWPPDHVIEEMGRTAARRVWPL